MKKRFTKAQIIGFLKVEKTFAAGQCVDALLLPHIYKTRLCGFRMRRVFSSMRKVERLWL
jgi:hypothetical protein